MFQPAQPAAFRKPGPTPEQTPVAAQTAKAKRGRPSLSITVSGSGDVCLKAGPCRVMIDIQNMSDEGVDTELYPVSFVLTASETAPRPTLSQAIGADFKLSDPQSPNQFFHFVLKGNEHFKKEIDLAELEWKTNRLSQIDYQKFRRLMSAGTYRLFAQIAINRKLIEPENSYLIPGKDEIPVPDNVLADSNLFALEVR